MESTNERINDARASKKTTRRKTLVEWVRFQAAQYTRDRQVDRDSYSGTVGKGAVQQHIEVKRSPSRNRPVQSRLSLLPNLQLPSVTPAPIWPRQLEVVSIGRHLPPELLLPSKFPPSKSSSSTSRCIVSKSLCQMRADPFGQQHRIALLHTTAASRRT